MSLHELDGVPQWPEAARRFLDGSQDRLPNVATGLDPAALPADWQPPGRRFRLAELLLALPLVEPARALVRRLPPGSVDPGRRAFLQARLDVRTTLEPLAPSLPLTPMRSAFVIAERATHQAPHAAERRQALDEVLRSPDSGFEADELRFLAAQQRASIYLTNGDASSARDLLEDAAAIAHRLGSPHDAASLQTGRFLACQSLGDRSGLVQVATEARAFASTAFGALPAAMIAQTLAGEDLRGGQAIQGIQTLDEGIRVALAGQDWEGLVALSIAKVRVCRTLGETYAAFRGLKVTGSLLRRHNRGDLMMLLKAEEAPFRAEVGEAGWATHTQRLREEFA